MSVELFINGSIIELSDKTNIGLTFQRNNIAELQTRQGNTSNEFSVPKTQSNQIAFENSDNVNSATYFPYRKLDAKITQNGIEIMPEAVASIEEADKNYKVIVNNGVTSFFDLLGEKKLSDLDLSASDHQWSMSSGNVIDFTRDDWRYLLIDWGNNFNGIATSIRANADRLIPVMFVKYLLEKCCSEVGYSVYGSFVDDSKYPRLLYTPDSFFHTEEWLDSKLKRGVIQTNYNLITSDAPLDGSSITTVYNILNTLADPPEMTGAGYLSYTPTENIFGNLSFNCLVEQISVSPDPSFLSFDIIRLSDSSVVATTGDIVADLLFGSILSVSIATGNIMMYPSDTFQFRCTMTYNRISPGITPQVRIYKDGVGQFTPYKEIHYGTAIDMASVYVTTQKNFIKDVLKMYCLNVYVNETTKKVRIDFFNDVKKNIPNAIDWSKKVDMKVIPVLSYSFGNYAQKNNFKWKDNEFVTKGFGDYYFLVDNEKLELESNQLEMLASATESEIKLGGIFCPKIKAIMSSTIEWQKVNNRFLLLDEQNGNVNYYDQSTDSSVTSYQTINLPFCYFKKTGKVDNLGFDDSLIDKHYGTIKGILDRVKYYSVAISPMLNAVDISQLDFNIPIYLDIHFKEFKVNGYFYLNRLENYSGNKNAVAKLLRL